MNRFILVVILSIACMVSDARGCVWKSCGSKEGSKVSVEISGCPDTMNPCKLYKGKNVDVTIKFTSLEAATKLTTVVHGVIAGIPIPFPVKTPNACENCNITCPLTSGTEYYYHSQIPIKSSYPSIKLTVKWELKDQSGADVVCILVPAAISSSGRMRLSNIAPFMKSNEEFIQ